MVVNKLVQTRRWAGYGLTGLFSVLMGWWLLPGIPVVWAPRADATERATGQGLFVHEWAPHDRLAQAKGDGLGPVFNARSCVACHFQGGVGGGGGNDHNVMAFEAHPTSTHPDVSGGLIHKFAVADFLLENRLALTSFFPIVKGGTKIIGGCTVVVRDFDPVRTESVNSTALFGAGWIDRIADRSIIAAVSSKTVARIARELRGQFDGIVPGRQRILPDGRLGKFGWKAQFATLEEFVAAACANEIGLGNPRMEQAKPKVRWSYPEVEPDLNAQQFRSLVAFVDTLPRPTEVVPSGRLERKEAERGKELFASIGCGYCHVPNIGGIEGVYSDFLLHRLDDQERGRGGYREVNSDVPLPEDHPFPEEWKTPPLWGVANSAPYFHDGGSSTLDAAIERHEGNAAVVTRTYRALSGSDQAAIIAFLKTLKAPVDAAPAPPQTPEPPQPKSSRLIARH